VQTDGGVLRETILQFVQAYIPFVALVRTSTEDGTREDVPESSQASNGPGVVVRARQAGAIVAAVGPVVLLVALAVAWLADRGEDSGQWRFREQLLPLLVELGQTTLETGSPTGLQQAVNALQQMPVIDKITVIDSDGRIVVTTDADQVGNVLAVSELERQREPDRLRLIRELRLGDDLLGEMVVQFRSDAERGVLSVALLVSGVGLLLLGFPGWWLAGRFGRTNARFESDLEQAQEIPTVPVDTGIEEQLGLAHLGREFARIAPELERLLLTSEVAGVPTEQGLAAGEGATWEWDVRNDGLQLSPRFGEALGCSPEAIPSRFSEWMGWVHPDDCARLKQELQEGLSTARPCEYEFRMRAFDGPWVWLHGHGQTALDAESNPVRMTGILADVPDHKKAATYLVETLVRLRVLIEALPDLVVFKDGAGRWQIVNPAAMDVFELSTVETARWQGRTDEEIAAECPILASHLRGWLEDDRRAWARLWSRSWLAE